MTNYRSLSPTTIYLLIQYISATDRYEPNVLLNLALFKNLHFDLYVAAFCSTTGASLNQNSNVVSLSNNCR